MFEDKPNQIKTHCRPSPSQRSLLKAVANPHTLGDWDGSHTTQKWKKQLQISEGEEAEKQSKETEKNVANPAIKKMIKLRSMHFIIKYFFFFFLNH